MIKESDGSNWNSINLLEWLKKIAEILIILLNIEHTEYEVKVKDHDHITGEYWGSALLNLTLS